ncbi:MAG: hypothetical protein KF841_06515 [Phycisphaerae bacterium]|nr:hypothetical protein [Phycisphaerae bacterium]
MNLLDHFMRWLHVMGAIVAGGAAIFALAALLPALKLVSDDMRATFHEAIRPKFAKLISAGIGALIISGVYNYVFVKMPLHKGQGLYHGLMGCKILLALAVFFIASALTGKARAFDGMRQKRAVWLTANVSMIAIIVAIGGILKDMK